MSSNTLKKHAEDLQAMELHEDFRVMEVCGTHTTEFFKTGVKDLFPKRLTLVDGPGCPVCVTPVEYLDRAIEIGKKYNAVITTFGDMIKVPSSYSSLGKELAEGMDVRVVYSPMETLQIAKDNPDKEVMFLSVGFETTAPTEAVTVKEAKRQNIKNFTILPGNKLTPPAVKALLAAEEVKLDGFIIPGHVSAVIGADAWNFIADDFGKPGVVAGFEARDLVLGTHVLCDMLNRGITALRNEYPLVVKPEGNLNALKLMNEVFNPGDSVWRGIGAIPESGLDLKGEYQDFDAGKKFDVTPPPPKEPKGCRCGELLRGLILPTECPLFGKGCTPRDPVGPCMVSTEGPCAAYFKYGRSES